MGALINEENVHIEPYFSLWVEHQYILVSAILILCNKL